MDAHTYLGSRLVIAQERGRELRARAARAALQIASTEDDGADLYQAMAEQREDRDPEHAERLRAMSAKARAFAATEREASRLLE